ncbi:hypothetical protein, partial [Mycobacterium marinum]|uniref:hypothetical protein n=1 Tax=Mycobacterium marinum TaxID=1781 RepID=UPI0021C38169
RRRRVAGAFGAAPSLARNARQKASVFDMGKIHIELKSYLIQICFIQKKIFTCAFGTANELLPTQQ